MSEPLTTLSVENVPEDVVGRLRLRAARNQRSLQDELLAVIEASVAQAKPFDAFGLLAEVRKIGVRSPSDSTAMIREDRDRR